MMPRRSAQGCSLGRDCLKTHLKDLSDDCQAVVLGYKCQGLCG
jgi:hypothetical protein